MLLEHDLVAAGTNCTRAGQFATCVFLEEASAYASALTGKLFATVTLPSIKGKDAMVFDTVLATGLLASSHRGSWFGGDPLIWQQLSRSEELFIVFLEGFTIEVINLLK